MLIPKRVKHRKQHHPGRSGAAKGGTAQELATIENGGHNAPGGAAWAARLIMFYAGGSLTP